jgi:predicted ATPase/transcriptional regulator with XRE-family HTH domain
MEVTDSFGTWIRRRRRALDLSQAELADRVGCAPITLRKIEADERRPSTLMAERLAQELGVDADRVEAFIAAARADRATSTLGSPVDRGSLGAPDGTVPSPITNLVGRRAELADLERLLSSSGGPARLVTITGPPGVGKTRLSLEVAHRVRGRHGLPVRFVSLADVRDPTLVADHIAASIALPPTPGPDRFQLLLRALRGRPSLLLLDDFERVLPAADVVVELLERCEGLAVMVTSRAALEVAGEHAYPLDPLPVPDPGRPIGDPESWPAVRLFLDRARAVDRSLRLEAELERVASICRRVDGLPLAIELAARQVRRLSIADLDGSLERDLAALDARGPREPGERMAGAVAWSYDLLDADARRVLRASSVFAGEFSLQDVHAVVDQGPMEQTATALQALVDRALLRRRPAEGGQRYGSLEVIRAFAGTRLIDEGEAADARRRHAAHVLAAIRSVTPPLTGWPTREAIAALAARDAEVMAALGWAYGDDGDVDLGRRLVEAQFACWYSQNRWAAARRWLDVAYQRAAPTERAMVAMLLALLGFFIGDLDTVDELLAEAVTGATGMSDPSLLGEALGLQAMLWLQRGDLVLARTQLDRCIELFQSAAMPEGVGFVHQRLARVALATGDVAEADRHTAAARSAYERAGSAIGIALVMSNEAEIHAARGATDRAIESYLESMDRLLALGLDQYATIGLAGVVSALVAAGRYRAAATVSGIVDAWLDELGGPLNPVFRPAYERDLEVARHALGAAFEEARAGARRPPPTAATVRELLGRE